ncbi:MAG: reverse transcriptase/maturase family protein [bacterium]
MEEELQSRTWQPSPSTAFVVTKPKIREIFAAPFRDRVVHHLLYSNLVPIWEPKFIHDSYACRIGKGTHRASVQRLPQFLRSVTVNGRKSAYCFQGDILSFFTSMSHDVLYRLIEKHISHPDLLWLAKMIIFHDATKDHVKHGQLNLFDEVPQGKSLFHVPRGKGLPIGNITSQFFANVYLNELDQYVKHRLKAGYYMRYVDDFLILHEDKALLNEWRKQINHFLRQHLELTLHPRKQTIFPIRHGIDFLGYVVWTDHVLVRKRVVRALKNKLWHFNKHISKKHLDHPTTLWTPELCGDFQAIYAAINSYYGLFQHADTFRLRRHIYEKHFGVLQAYLLPADNEYSHFIWNEG